MKITYQFAPLLRRLFAGIGDYLTIFIFSLLFMFLFLINTDINKVFTDRSYTIDGWRFFGYSVANFGLYFLYFVIIPYYCHGFSLWTYVARIKMIDHQNQGLTIKQIVKHDLFLWVLMMGWVIIIGMSYWIADAMKQAQSFLWGLFSFQIIQNSHLNQIAFGFGVFFKVVTTLLGIITGIFLINIIINRSTFSLIDTISDTYMVNKTMVTELTTDNVVNQTVDVYKPKNNLPGIFEEEE